MNIIRIVCIFVGAAFILLFIPPLIMYKIINIGNATGLLAGTILILYGFLANIINDRLGIIWNTKIGRPVFCALMAAFIICIIIACVISVLIIEAAKTMPAGDETLIVLGCQVKGTSPSLMLTERLNAAKEYLDKHENTVCILSGGKGPDEEISEAQCMYNYLTEHGISSGRLIMEDRSTSTRENLQYSLDIINKNNLNKNVALVTNEFHEYRSFKIAEKLDIHPAAVPAHTHWWLFSTYFVREWYGVIYEWTGMGK